MKVGPLPGLNLRAAINTFVYWLFYAKLQNGFKRNKVLQEEGRPHFYLINGGPFVINTNEILSLLAMCVNRIAILPLHHVYRISHPSQLQNFQHYYYMH